MSLVACEYYRRSVLRAWRLQCAGETVASQHELGWASFWWRRIRRSRCQS